MADEFGSRTIGASLSSFAYSTEIGSFRGAASFARTHARSEGSGDRGNPFFKPRVSRFSEQGGSSIVCVVRVKEGNETCIPFGWGERGLNFCSLAHLAPTREVPGVGKAATLLGFDGLNAALLAFKKDAGSVGLIDQGEAAAVRAKAGVGSDELGFLHFQKRGDCGDLFFRDFYVSWPAAAVGAALAKIFGGSFHASFILRRRSCPSKIVMDGTLGRVCSD